MSAKSKPPTSAVEHHPLEPFLPEGARILMLGSFPPPASRWSMDFYYPNPQNDMWRIFGMVFFGDKEYFTVAGERRFDKDKLTAFLSATGVALGDTARSVIRHKGNAADQFLEIVEPVDLPGILSRLPLCNSIVTTGGKATATLCDLTSTGTPCVGGSVSFGMAGRTVHHYRMPSSSRAYPLALDKKAEYYRELFLKTGRL